MMTMTMMMTMMMEMDDKDDGDAADDADDDDEDSDTAEDDVSGHLMHSDLHQTQEVNSGDVVEILWHNSSIIGTTVMNMTESDIIALLENQDGLGIGQHVLQISVDVNRGDCLIPPGENDDNSETVEYSIELISLEYDLEMVEDAEEEEEEEDSEE